jgi:hypothetical protein
MFCWDLGFGWFNRHETREIARKGREAVELALAEREDRRAREQAELNTIEIYGHTLTLTESPTQGYDDVIPAAECTPSANLKNQPATAPIPQMSENGDGVTLASTPSAKSAVSMLVAKEDQLQTSQTTTGAMSILDEKQELSRRESPRELAGASNPQMDENGQALSERTQQKVALSQNRQQTTLVSLAVDSYRWAQETFPTVTAVVAHLPFALIPFAFTMFVLVQALVTKGWVAVFAYGWDHWVNKTGTIGSIGGMGFLGVVLCNVSLTNSTNVTD